MKTKNRIFNKSLLRTLGVAAVLMPVAAFAAGTGCDEDSGNDFINPELALCSTHVYNIGGIENPKNDAEKEIMRDVVALKTTVMTQQMYKQYEYLESMLKRFRTQLEKAVLTTKLQAAGASDDTDSYSSSSGGSYSSRNNNSYAVIEGAKDCNEKLDKLEALQCVQSNLGVVLNALNNRKVSDASRQLTKDVQVLNSWEIKLTSCNTLSGDSAVRSCFQSLRTKVATEIDDYKKAQRKIDMD